MSAVKQGVVTPSKVTTANARQGGTARHGKGKLTPYQRLEEWIWSNYMAFEGTFVFSMLEGWERLTLLFLFIGLTLLLWWSIVFQFPNHVRFMIRKGHYYIYGTDHTEL